MPGPQPPKSAIAQAQLRRIEVRGRDLCGELMGSIGFTDYMMLVGLRVHSMYWTHMDAETAEDVYSPIVRELFGGTWPLS